MSLPTLVIVPGLGGSAPEHWQSLWEARFGGVRVCQDDPDAPDPVAWAARLGEVVAATPGELILVAHSCGVLTVSDWAAQIQGAGDGGAEYGGAGDGVPGRVRGALLVAPPDPADPGALALAPALSAYAGFSPAPLPFPALVVGSETDPYAAPEYAPRLAEIWDAAYVSAGEAGHLNVASGHGEWPEGEVLLSEALHAWTPPALSRLPPF